MHIGEADILASGSVRARSAISENLSIAGRWHCRQWRRGKVIWEGRHENLITTEGRNYTLDSALHEATQVTTWYIGLIDGTPTIAAADTLASHAGWTEVTDYTGDRQEWTEGAPAAGSITNSTAVSFPITGTVTVGGLFLASAATGTVGTLFAAGALSSGDRALLNGDTFDATVTISLTSS